MTEYQTLRFEQSGSIARITLNRPNSANGIDHVLGRELAQLASLCADDPALAVVTLTGAGKFFAAWRSEGDGRPRRWRRGVRQGAGR